MLMIIIRIEWDYLVEPVEHLQEKDGDAVMNGVERLDVSHLDVSHLDASHLDASHLDAAAHQALAEDQEVLQDATALVEDM